MLHRTFRKSLIVCSTLFAAAALAQPPSPQPPPGGAPPALRGDSQERAQPPGPSAAPGRNQPPRQLEAVTARLAQTVGKDFVVDPRLRGVDLGLVDVDEIDYESLLSLLRVHDAVVIEGVDAVYVVPEQNARFYATPLVQRDDADLHPATWVARVITTSTDATQMLGVLRPLATQSAVMGIHAPNKVLIVERYDNVKRITEIVRMLDQR